VDRDDIIRMAREAGIRPISEFASLGAWIIYDEWLERFAKLVAASEREACARHFDENTNRSYYGYHISSYIRSRGQNGL
jgi:hypothetical protein